MLRDALLPPFDPRDYASPLSAFRKYVKDDDTVELFTVQGLPAGARIRLATFDRFDGVVWNVAGDGSSRASGQFRRVGEVVSEQAVEEADAVAASGTGGERAEVRVQVDGLSGVWLPTVGDAVSVQFDDSEAQSRLRFNDATGAAVLTGGLDEGLTYTLDAVVPAEPDDEQLGSAAGSALDLPEPQDVPDAVSTAAGDAAREAETPAQVARFTELQALVAGMAADFEKFYKDGNKAAGTRVRLAMQELKNFAQNVRNEVQSIKNGGKTGETAESDTDSDAAQS